MGLLHLSLPLSQWLAGVVCPVVIVHLLALEDGPAGHGEGGPPPEHDDEVGVAAVIDQGQGGVDTAADPVHLDTVPDVEPMKTT